MTNREICHKLMFPEQNDFNIQLVANVTSIVPTKNYCISLRKTIRLSQKIQAVSNHRKLMH